MTQQPGDGPRLLVMIVLLLAAVEFHQHVTASLPAKCVMRDLSLALTTRPVQESVEHTVTNLDELPVRRFAAACLRSGTSRFNGGVIGGVFGRGNECQGFKPASCGSQDLKNQGRWRGFCREEGGGKG